MAEKKQESGSLSAPGFRLLKPGITIAQYHRAKDVKMKRGDKQHTEPIITKAAYVPHAYIRANSLGLSYFEEKSVDKVPAIDKISKKSAADMLDKVNKKLA